MSQRNKIYLILDVSNLCHRAFHVMGELSFGAIKTGVVYGFLRQVLNLQERFGPTHTIFAFDGGVEKRRELLPTYKIKRHAKYTLVTNKEERQAHDDLLRQILLLRKEYLPKIGFKNILCQRGYEADDIIASVVKNAAPATECIIVSSDKDLLQLLTPYVKIYNPANEKLMGFHQFRKKYDISPWRWARVKAICGCPTDEIPGVKGVGEKTALKYLLDELPHDSKKYHAIQTPKNQDLIYLNTGLVKLPFKGTHIFPIEEDMISPEGWKEVCRQLGLKSLDKDLPLRGEHQLTFQGL